MKCMRGIVVNSCEFIYRRRAGCAAVLGVFSFCMLFAGLGLGRLLPLPVEAVADDIPRVLHSAPASLLAPEQARLLQASVDSVTLGMSGALTTLPDDEARRKALGAALDALSFEFGGELYFTAWHNTYLVHSPLSPDAASHDFSEALDDRGSSFVREMEKVAAAGGGFMTVTLPRQLPQPLPGVYRAPVHLPAGTAPLRMNPDAAMVTQAIDALSAQILAQSGKITVAEPAALPTSANTPRADAGRTYNANASGALPHSDPRPLFDSTPVEQAVYVREIPGTQWHVAAFLPGGEASRADGGIGFSSVLSGNAESGPQSAQKKFRQGLCFSGLSLAGLAGLLLVPSSRAARTDAAGRALEAERTPPTDAEAA